MFGPVKKSEDPGMTGALAVPMRCLAAAIIVAIVSGGIATAHADGADRGGNSDAIDNQNDAILAMPEHPKKAPSAQPKQPARQVPCAPPAEGRP